jgi:hypothetical protein
MLLDVQGHPRDVLGHLIALKYKSVQVEPSQDMEKGENPPRDRLIYWDIQGYTVISRDIRVYPGIYQDFWVYHRI